MGELIDLDRFRFNKRRSEDIKSLQEVLIALREATATLEASNKYPLINAIYLEILEARQMVLENIERLQRQEKEDEHEKVHSK